MFKDFKRLVYVCMAFVMAIVFSACGGGGGGGGGVAGSGTTGTLSLGLTDAPGDYLNVFITIEEVWVDNGPETEENWVLLDLPNLPQTFDLMALQNGVIAPLGAVELEAGHYNQMRLLLSEPSTNYLVIEGEEGEPVEVDLKTPSSYKEQSGYKIVKGFDIEVAGSTELTLDFNVEKSIVQAGKSGKWILKPTVKVLETVTFSVSGVVEDEGSVPINGAAVTAQVYDPGAIEPEDEIAIATGTVSANIEGTDGAYFMYLPITQDKFNIVATRDGYLPECQVLDKTATGVMAYVDYDFTLAPAADTGTLIGSMTGLAESADSAIFSIRQSADCGSGPVMIEVASASVVKTVAPDPVVYFDPISLPVGTYEVVVSAEGEVSQVWNIEVGTDPTVLDVFFPTTSVEGIVDDGVDPLKDALISVQAYDPGAVDLQDAIEEIVAVESDAGGFYFTYLPTDQSSFNIVATLDGYLPECQIITELISNIADFSLDPVVESGTVSGLVSGLAAPEDSALLSIRRSDLCASVVEVGTLVVPNDTAYNLPLPAGTYQIVASADGETTLEFDGVVVVDVTDTPLDIAFP
jgi:hypothetical protein